MLKKIVKGNWLIIIIILLAFLLRLYFLSPWLEDWDSVQFALALKDFSLIKQQPHSPGYPLYIFLGRIFNFFLHNDTLSLTSLSAVLGSLSAFPLYFLIADITKNKKIALLSIIVFLVTPIQWNLSEVALSNTPGMFFSISAVYLIFKGRNSLKMLLWGSFLSGIALGVRFAEYSTVIVLLGFVLWVRKRMSNLVKSAVYLITGILVWLIPLILDTGFETFVALYKNQVGYIVNHDSLLAQSSSIVERLVRIKQLLTVGYTPYFFAILLVVAVFLINQKTYCKKYWLAVCLNLANFIFNSPSFYI
ncbi:MAG: glycosyltransferase family 39 protein [Patescibacteria group bacterium]